GAWSAPAGGNLSTQPRATSPYQSSWPAATRSPYDPSPVLPPSQKMAAGPMLPTLDRPSERPAQARPQGPSGVTGTALDLAAASSSTTPRLAGGSSAVVPVSSSVVKGPLPQQ